MSDASMPTGTRHPLTNVAVGLAIASVIAWVALVASDADGPIWLVQVALSAAALVTAWMAGGRSTRNLPAFIALVVGALGLLSFVSFLISEI